MMVFAPIWFHINDFELLRTVPGTEFRCASFPCSKKPPILRISLFFRPRVPGARAHGPPGAHGAQLGGWGKLPTVRQSYLLSGMHPTTAYFAPNNRIHAPNRSIDMHPKGIDMHPKVSIYFAPNFRILCTQPSHRHAPKRHRLCTQK